MCACIAQLLPYTIIIFFISLLKKNTFIHSLFITFTITITIQQYYKQLQQQQQQWTFEHWSFIELTWFQFKFFLSVLVWIVQQSMLIVVIIVIVSIFVCF